MSTTEPTTPAPEPEGGPSIEAEREAELTTEAGTEISHAEQTSVDTTPDEEEAEGGDE
jgi:hypothetical protein